MGIAEAASATQADVSEKWEAPSSQPTDPTGSGHEPVMLWVPLFPLLDAGKRVHLLVQVPQVRKTPWNVVLRDTFQGTADPTDGTPDCEVRDRHIVASAETGLTIVIQNALQPGEHHCQAAIIRDEALPPANLPLQVHLLNGVGEQIRCVGQAA
eukprot:CAMPEP_0171187324 /NCGR_PEP_ID=MMETSP0790-20130122/17263_1 /TAXON_ID=2925 /ORGANISM="Alexandrium catenella, Strain OF101" /LENGTH=153 /DNA_ID=CAMNT_0011652383 /DNA_START=95 /DNA_END=557 /DNA_ORIENTATION=+